jgi:hypothetical protein
MQVSMAFCDIEVFYSYTFSQAIIIDVVKYTALYFCNTGLQFLSKQIKRMVTAFQELNILAVLFAERPAAYTHINL